MMRVPFLDLKAQYRSLRGEILRAIKGVLEAQRFILAENVRALEDGVQEFLSVDHAVGVASGSDAILLSLMALGIGRGDTVITTPFTFFATAGSVVRTGALPAFVDVEPTGLNLDPEGLAECVQGLIGGKGHPCGKRIAHTSRVKALLPVHLFGRCAAMGPIMGVARTYGLKVVEDAAQAFGASCRLEGRGWYMAGTMGDTGCFSFFPSKNLGGYGDGGMVVTRDEALAQSIRKLRVHGANSSYHHSMIGINSRLDELQAAVLRVKLSYISIWNRMRREKADVYRRLLKDAGLVGTCIEVPEDPREEVGDKPGFTHIYHQFVIRAKGRDRLRAYLKEKGIDTAIYYPLPLHLQTCFRDLGYREGDLPNAERAAREVLALPIYPELPLAHQEYVVEMMEEFYKRGSST